MPCPISGFATSTCRSLPSASGEPSGRGKLGLAGVGVDVGGADMELEVVVTSGLGDNSYLVSSGDEAAVVDPQRDVERLLSLAESRHLKVRYVLETHVH